MRSISHNTLVLGLVLCLTVSIYATPLPHAVGAASTKVSISLVSVRPSIVSVEGGEVLQFTANQSIPIIAGGSAVCWITTTEVYLPINVSGWGWSPTAIQPGVVQFPATISDDRSRERHPRFSTPVACTTLHTHPPVDVHLSTPIPRFVCAGKRCNAPGPTATSTAPGPSPATPRVTRSPAEVSLPIVSAAF